MDNDNKRKIIEPYFQVKESFLQDTKIIKIIKKYGDSGLGKYIRICLMLLVNNNNIEYDCSLFQNSKKEVVMIEDILNNFGLFSIENNFISSEVIDKQLKERGKISEQNSIKGLKSAEKRKAEKQNEITPKPKPKSLTSQETADALAEIERLQSLNIEVDQKEYFEEIERVKNFKKSKNSDNDDFDFELDEND